MDSAAKGIRGHGTEDAPDERLDEAAEAFLEDVIAFPGPVWPRGLIRALHQDEVANRRVLREARKISIIEPAGGPRGTPNQGS